MVTLMVERLLRVGKHDEGQYFSSKTTHEVEKLRLPLVKQCSYQKTTLKTFVIECSSFHYESDIIAWIDTLIDLLSKRRYFYSLLYLLTRHCTHYRKKNRSKNKDRKKTQQESRYQNKSNKTIR
jgi:hypothetical protein